MREVITAPLPGLDLRQHYGYYQSPAIRASGLTFCSGMIPVDPQTGERCDGTLTSEAHVIFGNLNYCSSRQARRSNAWCRCTR